MLGLPVYHQFLEFTQTHVHRVGDAIQPSHPLSSPSAPTFNLSQHQGLLQCKQLELRIWNFDSAVVIGFIVFILRTEKSSEFNELNGFCFIASFEMLKNLEISRRSDALYYTFLNKPQIPSDAYRKKTVIL